MKKYDEENTMWMMESVLPYWEEIFENVNVCVCVCMCVYRQWHSAQYPGRVHRIYLWSKNGIQKVELWVQRNNWVPLIPESISQNLRVTFFVYVTYIVWNMQAFDLIHCKLSKQLRLLCNVITVREHYHPYKKILQSECSKTAVHCSITAIGVQYNCGMQQIPCPNNNVFTEVILQYNCS